MRRDAPTYPAGASLRSRLRSESDMTVQQAEKLANPANPSPVSAWEAQKEMWLRQVAADPEIRSAAAMKVAVLLAQRFNRETGEGWGTAEGIAQALGLHPDTVKSAFRALRKRGHIVPVTKGRPGHSTHYVMGMRGGSAGQPAGGKGGRSAPEKGADSPPNGGPLRPPEPLNRTSEGTSSVPSGENGLDEERQSPALTEDVRDLLDRIRDVHPKKSITPRAERAAASAITKADAETIIEGARKYARTAAEGRLPEGRRDPMHISKWLEKEGWRYEGGDPASGRYSSAEHVRAIIRQREERQRRDEEERERRQRTADERPLGAQGDAQAPEKP